jgi:hypothetical protein
MIFVLDLCIHAWNIPSLRSVVVYLDFCFPTCAYRLASFISDAGAGVADVVMTFPARIIGSPPFDILKNPITTLYIYKVRVIRLILNHLSGSKVRPSDKPFYELVAPCPPSNSPDITTDESYFVRFPYTGSI